MIREAEDIMEEIANYFTENKEADFLYTSSRTKGSFIVVKKLSLFIYLDRLDVNIVKKITDNPIRYLFYFREFLIKKFNITVEEILNMYNSYIRIEYDVHDPSFAQKYLTDETLEASLPF